MRRRPGITLVEVLIAIFIMAIGLLALLTLFPLGALRMAQALQADRTASAASAGANTCDAFNMRRDPNLDFVDPPTPNSLNLPPASQIGGGFPVYVDPYGVASGSGPLGFSAATSPATPGIPRPPNVPSVIPQAAPYWTFNAGPPPSWTLNPSAIAARYFTLLDDISFATNGQPDLSTNFIQRGDRYTWAYLLHKTQLRAPNSNLKVDLQVVVYAGRSTTSANAGESTFAAVGNVNDTAVALSFAGSPPDIRRGTWILDTSYNPVSGSVHGDFYRVVSVTPVGANTLNLELQTTISKPISAVTVMDKVVDVFERGTGDSSKWEFRNN